nr:hypothetical protein GCM10020092_074880 [Actinoplanes digitatis]
MGDADEWMRGFRAIAAPESEQERFAGAVLVCRRDERILAEAYGMADRERKIPNEVSTRFRNGSLTKMFTAVAVVRLIQAGLVDPDAPVGTYLSDYPNSEVASKVTVHHLLTHTGGTGDFFSPEYEEHRTELRTVADYLRLFGERARRFEPGAWFDYSNYGFILLGAVIERVSGQSYYDYVDDHVFAPSGDAAQRRAAVRHAGGRSGRRIHGRGRAGLPRHRHPAVPGLARGRRLHHCRGPVAVRHRADRQPAARRAAHRPDDHGEAERRLERQVRRLRLRRSHGLRHPYARPHRRIAGRERRADDFFPDSGHVVAVLANLDPPIASQVSEFICHRLPVSRTARCRTC